LITILFQFFLYFNNYDKINGMNVYDFDGTIYKGDSNLDFYLHCVRKYPRLLSLIPIQLLRFIASLPSGDRTTLKQVLYYYLPRVPDILSEVDLFWQTHGTKIYPWYLAQKREDDVIISASPRFILEPICKGLGVSLIASEVDPATGKCIAKNCSGRNKPERILEFYKDCVVDEFYSDSNNDLPMARMARRAYKVRRGVVGEWRL